MNIEQIAHRCEKVRWKGKASFTACCVAHNDRNPSMRVTEADDGMLLVHCFSGCPQDAVLEALGMKGGKRDNYVPAPRIRPEPKPKSDYYKKIWNNAYDVLLPFSKPFKGDINHLVSTHTYALFKDIGHEYGARRGKASGRLIGKDADVIVVPSHDIDGNLMAGPAEL